MSKKSFSLIGTHRQELLFAKLLPQFCFANLNGPVHTVKPTSLKLIYNILSKVTFYKWL